MKKITIAGLALLAAGAVIFGAGFIGARGDLSVANGNIGPFKVQVADGHIHSGFFHTGSADGSDSTHGIGGGRDKPMTTPPPAIDTGDASGPVPAENSDMDSQSFAGEDVREIELNINLADVELLPSFDGKVTVSSDKLEDFRLALDKNGMLSVESRNMKSVVTLGLLDYRPQLTVRMPKDMISSLKVENSCGNIKLDKLVVGDVELSTAMGDVYMHMTECLSAELSADCGKATAFHVVSAGELSVDSDMGDVRAENCEVGGKLSAESSCGKVSVIDCSSADAEISSDLGDVSVTRLDCIRTIKLDCDCGAIKFTTLSAAKSIEIENSMGSIEGTLAGDMSDYSIESEVDLGSSNLPNSLKMGSITLKVSADCGSIDISFEDD